MKRWLAAIVLAPLILLFIHLFFTGLAVMAGLALGVARLAWNNLWLVVQCAILVGYAYWIVPDVEQFLRRAWCWFGRDRTSEDRDAAFMAGMDHSTRRSRRRRER